MRIVPMALALVICACADRPSPIQTAIELTKSSGTPMPLVALTPLDVSSQVAIDSLEASWNGRASTDALAEALAALAAEHPPSEPLLLQRVAMLRFERASRAQQGLDRAIAAGSDLRKLAPDSPETLYLEGWIPWTLLGTRTSPVSPADMRTFVQSVVARWGTLLEKFPTYQGPHGVDAADIAREVERFRAMLAHMPAAPVPDSPPPSPHP